MEATANHESELDLTEDQEPGKLESIFSTMRKFATVSELLRFAGAAVIVASMSLFLVNGLQVDNDIQRYLTLLAQTLLLTTGGFALSRGLQENKGARVFFGLGLVSVPANFAVLGALIYSWAPWDSLSANYPAFAHWIAGSGSSIGLTALVAVALLVPVTLFGFSVMARGSSKPLTVAFMLSNAGLLLPLRDTAMVVPIATVITLAVLWFLHAKLPLNTRLATPTGRFARMSLLIAPGIMFARSLYLYDFSAAVVLCLAVAVYFILRHASRQSDGRGLIAQILDLTSIVVGLVAAGAASSMFEFYDDSLHAIVFAAAATVILGELAWRTRSASVRTTAYVVNVIATAGTLILVGLFDSGIATTFATLAVAVCYTVWGGLAGSRIQLFTGILVIVMLLISRSTELLYLVDLGNWLVLAIVGAAAIILGSVVDRHGTSIKLRMDRWFEKKVSANEQRASDAT